MLPNCQLSGLKGYKRQKYTFLHSISSSHVLHPEALTSNGAAGVANTAFEGTFNHRQSSASFARPGKEYL